MHAYVGPPFNRPLVHWNDHGCVPAMTSPHRQTHVLAGAHPFIGSFTSNVHPGHGSCPSHLHSDGGSFPISIPGSS